MSYIYISYIYRHTKFEYVRMMLDQMLLSMGFNEVHQESGRYVDVGRKLSTIILASAWTGTPKPQMSSCFLLTMKDCLIGLVHELWTIPGLGFEGNI